ncbi:MAG: prepilin-type N-terminal cleavage/methylation domain-containing protein, partial [Clostridiales bacterium]|nr:prepilin-type N-terminal cleavage/methylation domain-containing protein [Clostridiales bacterium]
MKKLNNKRAFTIVELIIVIAVIGVLAAILIPAFT